MNRANEINGNAGFSRVGLALGDLDRAFEYLDRALAEEPASLSYIMTDPTVDPIRDDPRYDALLEKLGVD